MLHDKNIENNSISGYAIGIRQKLESLLAKASSFLKSINRLPAFGVGAMAHAIDPDSNLVQVKLSNCHAHNSEQCTKQRTGNILQSDEIAHELAPMLEAFIYGNCSPIAK